MATISVTGVARRLLRPDRGTVRVLVHVEGARRDEVATSAGALHERLTDEARRFVADRAATDWSADQVWVSTADRYQGEKQKPKRVAVASAAVRVTFVEFAVLSRWLGEVAEQEGVEVHGIEWALAEDRRRAVEGEVRTEAVLDALERARVYAAALGLETVEPARVSEPGLRPEGESGGGMAYRTTASFGTAAAPPEFDVRPEELEVRAEVGADFTAR